MLNNFTQTDKVTEENVDQINEVQNEVKLENNQPNLPEDYMFTVSFH